MKKVILALGNKKFLISTISLIILLSSLLVVNFVHTASAQDFGFSAKNQNNPTSGNQGVTGSQNTKSPEKKTDHASIRLSPDHGPAGTTFNIYGIMFVSGDEVHIISPFDDLYVVADNSGYFVAEMSVPAGETPGEYPVSANGEKQSADATFTVTGKKVVTNPSVSANIKHTTNPPPPPPPQPPAPTSSANGGGGGSDLPYITLDPTSGPPGTMVKITGGNFMGDVTLSAGGTVVAKGNSLDTNVAGHINTESDGSISGSVIIPDSAQLGPYQIQVDSSAPIAKATFMVTGKKIVSSNTLHAATGTIPPTPGITKTVPDNAIEKINKNSTSYSRTTFTNNGWNKYTPGGSSKPLQTRSTYNNNTASLTHPSTPKYTAPTIPKSSSKTASCTTGSFTVNGQCVSKGKVVAALQ